MSSAESEEAKMVLVSYNGSNKPVRVPPGANGLSFLINKCITLFKFEDNVRLDFLFQKFDKEWDEMVDLDDDYVLCHKDKLNLVVQPSLSPLVNASGLSVSCDSLEPCDSPVLCESVDSDSPCGSIELDRKRDRNPDTDDTLIISDSPHKKLKVGMPHSVEKKGNDETPIPHPFPFPNNYRPDVQVCLKSGRMTAEARRHFLSSIAATMFAFQRYPTKEDFTAVAMEIITKYPFLKSKVSPATGAIVQTLINRFKEFRRCKKDTSSISSSHSSSNSTTKTSRKSKHPGQSFSIPKVPAGEDTTSFERHNKAIQMELAKKGRCNKAIVKELVSVSFPMRRQDIRNTAYHIKDVLRKYPFFKEQDLFFFEVEKISGLDRLQLSVKECWGITWSSKILHQADLEISSNIRLRGLMAKFPSADKFIFSLCVLPYLLRDARCKPDHEKLVCFCPESCDLQDVIADKGQSEPFLLMTGSMEEPVQCFLIVDQEILFEVDVKDSVLAIVSAFFVFDIVYTRSLNSVFIFLESILLGTNTKLPVSVSNFISVLS